MKQPVHVCHITTVHPQLDVRIFHKECVSLAEAGYRVTLLVGNGKGEQVGDVQIIGVDAPYSGRLQRFRKVSKAVYQEALKVNADVYHFHDPEFLPFAVKLQRKGKRVIYDVHEDLPRQVLSKHYLPKWFAKMLSAVLEWYENKAAAKLDAIVTATDHIADRFSKVNKTVRSVKNYPILNDLLAPTPFEQKKPQPCHIGSLTGVRGVTELVDAMEFVDAELQLAGKFSPESLEAEVRRSAGWNNVKFHGFANRQMVSDILAQSMVGTVTLYKTISYVDALPVKMFEYMAAGIPVVASDIPLWKEIVDKADCGLTVNPKDSRQIAAAINQLLSDPKRAEAMGASGRKAVEEEYNWKSQSEILVNLYKTIGG